MEFIKKITPENIERWHRELDIKARKAYEEWLKKYQKQARAC